MATLAGFTCLARCRRPKFSPMHPRLAEIHAANAAVRAELAAFLSHCTPEQLQRDPGDGKWSVAQVIEHLGRTEGSIAKLLEGLFAKGVAEGLPEDAGTASRMASLDRFRVQSRHAPLVAPERLVPSAQPVFAEAWASLQQVRQRTLAAVATVDGLDITRVSAPHPFLGALDGYQWVLFLGQHEARHLAQIREIVAGA